MRTRPMCRGEQTLHCSVGGAPSLNTSLSASAGREQSRQQRRRSLARSCCSCCPKPTNMRLTCGQCSRGSHDSSCTRVPSGSLLDTQPRMFMTGGGKAALVDL